MAEGWVAFYRKTWDNPISSKKGWMVVWLAIISMANHEDNIFIWNGENMTIKRGQWLTSLETIEKLTQETRQTVRSVIQYLATNKMIEQQVTNKFRIITVLKYEEYQIKKTKLTNKKQTSNKPATTNNNDNNENKNTELDKTAKILLDWFNKTMHKNCKTFEPFKSNLAYWLTIYTKEDIAKAIVKMPGHKFFSQMETPVVIFRRKNQNREDVDYIGQLLNSTPVKNNDLLS